MYCFGLQTGATFGELMRAWYVEETKEIREAAASLGRRGGLKGGPARMKKLSKERRTEIARDAAFARWANQRTGNPMRCRGRH